MARILYGVHGTANGHAIRALTVARHYPEHEFLFVSHGEGATLLAREHAVFQCPNPETRFHFHRVATFSTAYHNFLFRLQQMQLEKALLKLMDGFKPDVALTDYEFFVPRVSRRTGLSCLSLDHQHVVTLCSLKVPLSQTPSRLMTSWAVQRLFSNASHYMVTSFFRPPLKRSASKARRVRPLLREALMQADSRNGEHVLAYQSKSTFNGFFPLLQSIGRPVIVYGFNSSHTEGNLQFRKHTEEGLIEDLASCSYVICGGGHTLISEALFFGKPVISFPIRNAFEQYLNAFYLQKLGYGYSCSRFNFDPNIISSFEARLGGFRKNIARENFLGNVEIFALLDHFIEQKSLPAGSEKENL